MKFLSKHIYPIFLVAVFSLPLAAQAALPDFTKIVDASKNSVVNISTKSKTRSSPAKKYNIPELPEGSPFGELFDKFFDQDEFERRHRDAQSLGSESNPGRLEWWRFSGCRRWHPAHGERIRWWWFNTYSRCLYWPRGLQTDPRQNRYGTNYR